MINDPAEHGEAINREGRIEIVGRGAGKKYKLK